jgi:hypothetical protein
VTTTALTEALNRDAGALLAAYRSGTWVPAPAERELVEGLARGRWDASFFRAALRDVAPTVRAGRLIDVLEPAVDVFDQAAAAPADVVLQLRVLVDALTAEP